MNSWSFTGNLGGDAEMRVTQGGTSVLNFKVASTSGWGQDKKTTWTRCSLFGKQAEALQQYLTKGQLVGIVGELSVRDYQDKEGANRYSVEVKVNDVTLLGSKGGASQSEPKAAPKSAPKAQPEPATADAWDDDIPF